MTTAKIVQMMPAHGWVARFQEEEGEYLSPLVGWAVLQNGDETRVAGLVAGEKAVEVCDQDEDFLGYAYMPDTIEDMLDDLDDDYDEDFEDDDEDDEPPAPPRRPTRLN